MGVIKESLLRLGLADSNTIKVFSAKTRDVSPLAVHIDASSGVIFIDSYYVGDATYEGGSYRTDDPDTGNPEAAAESQGNTYVNFEDRMDTLRRLRDFEHLYAGRSICDFGCGAGSFLKGVKDKAAHVAGVELQQSYRHDLSRSGVPCFKALGEVPQVIDTLFMFHSFEHLPDPAQCLVDIQRHLKAGGGGRIVIEVPHARDFLIQTAKCQAFIDFTLWSQHLILHTQDSLRAFLSDAGFSDISVTGVQRYPLSNHLHWLSAGKPGGHKTHLARLDTDETTAAYANSLRAIDATDTLVAVARA